jgi:hypothetical protein
MFLELLPCVVPKTNVNRVGFPLYGLTRASLSEVVMSDTKIFRAEAKNRSGWGLVLSIVKAIDDTEVSYKGRHTLRAS